MNQSQNHKSILQRTWIAPRAWWCNIQNILTWSKNHLTYFQIKQRKSQDTQLMKSKAKTTLRFPNHTPKALPTARCARRWDSNPKVNGFRRHWATLSLSTWIWQITKTESILTFNFLISLQSKHWRLVCAVLKWTEPVRGAERYKRRPKVTGLQKRRPYFSR